MPPGHIFQNYVTGVDKALAAQNAIVVCNTPGALDISVAEHALWLMGSLNRDLSRLEARFRAGSFAGEAGRELYGKHLGILGFGQIGRRVAQIAAFGFGMKVWAAGTAPLPEWEQREGRPFSEWQKEFGVERYTHRSEELFSTCDCLSLHLPASPATRHYINAERLRRMKPSAVLVNTSRGSVVDEAGLYDALVNGTIRWMCLSTNPISPWCPARTCGSSRTRC